MTLSGLLAIYLCFRLKQWLCDYIQPGNIATTKHKSFLGEGGEALAIHAGGHSAGTLLIMLIFAPQLWWLAGVDFVVHGLIDRAKSVFVEKNKLKDDSIKYWLTFGLDQEAHNLTHLAYIIMVFVTLNGGVPTLITG